MGLLTEPVVEVAPTAKHGWPGRLPHKTEPRSTAAGRLREQAFQSQATLAAALPKMAVVALCHAVFRATAAQRLTYAAIRRYGRRSLVGAAHGLPCHCDGRARFRGDSTPIKAISANASAVDGVPDESVTWWRLRSSERLR